MRPLFAVGMRHQGAWDIPPTPTNEERVRAFRAQAPVELGNGLMTERLRARDYAREAVPGHDYDDNLAAAAAFRYGSN